jgi:sugar lactone lactonase YvrE
MAPDANPSHAWLYVASFAGDFSQPRKSVITIYDMGKARFPKIGSITRGLDGPSGITLDASGTLYVTNFKGGDVTIYPPGATHPSLTLSQALVNPSDVAVNSSGDVYVANRGGSVSDIIVYPAGKTTPSEIIQSNLIQAPGDCILDSAGDLYVSDRDTGVYVIPAGSQQPQSLNLQGLSGPAGLALDGSGNLFVGNLNGSAQQSSVAVYPAGSVNPAYTLPNTPFTDFITVGVLHRKQYVMVSASQGDTVTFFKDKARSASFAVFTPNIGSYGVALKPAGLP